MSNVSAPLMPMQQGHLAPLQTGLDFVNTLDFWPVPHDHLDSPQAALEWLASHDLMHREARDDMLHQFEHAPAAGWQLLSRLHRIREAMRGVVEASVARRAPDPADLGEVNRAMRTHYIYELLTIATRATRSTEPWRAWPRASHAR
ncbi:MAG: hypothetical protein E6I22_08685 [Chloroflexi bacterium]|nr:MAG: hypothetical protein E6I22_08685 [Chloroflexota bacterium]